MPKLRYMGGHDTRLFEKGEDWGGRLATPLAQEVRFDWANHHLVDTDEAGVPSEVVELLLEDPEIKDVTGLKKYPSNVAEQRWRGVPASVDAEAVEAGETSRPDVQVNPDTPPEPSAAGGGRKR